MAFAATLPVAVLCTGCVSTQTIAARARLVDARIRAGEKVTVVKRANPDVTVAPPVVIRGRGAVSAIVVSLHSDAPHVLTDLPISVGVRTRSGRRVYLNASGTADYFESHVASIGPRAALSWVFTTGRRLPAGRVFATVGSSALRASDRAPLPGIAATARVGRGAGTVAVSIRSRSAIPQYDMPLYVVAVRGGRVVAAGQAAVAHLGTDEATNVTVGLVGTQGAAGLHVIALPTIFS